MEYITQIMDMTGYAAKLGLIKSNHGYDKLCCETQVNPTYLFLNIKKKYNLEFFLKSNHIFYWLSGLPRNLPSQQSNIDTTLIQFNFKFKLNKKLNQKVLRLIC